MTKSTNTTIWATIATERRRLADELAALTDEQWSVASQCPGWTVEDVAAHLIMPFEVSTPRFGLAMLKHLGNFDKVMVDLTAKVRANNTRQQVIDKLRANAESQWTPPGGGPESPLGEIIVHGQDIRRPLGLEHDIPAATIELAISGMKEAELRTDYASRIGVPVP